MGNEPRYCDYYGNMSFADFTLNAANGTLDNYEITARESKD